MNKTLDKFRPMALGRRQQPFNHEDWIFELKYDGFRARAYIKDSECRLVSRKGSVFKSFAGLSADIAGRLKVQSTVLDSEIVYLDEDGKPQFYELMRRKAEGHPFSAVYIMNTAWRSSLHDGDCIRKGADPFFAGDKGVLIIRHWGKAITLSQRLQDGAQRRKTSRCGHPGIPRRSGKRCQPM